MLIVHRFDSIPANVDMPLPPHDVRTTLHLLLLACLVAALFPASVLIPWSLTDDGVGIKFCRDISSAFQEGRPGDAARLICFGIRGRFLPLCWGKWWVRYALFGLHSSWYHLSRLCDLFILLVLVYFFARLLCGTGEMALFVSVLTMASLPASQCWYRVFTAEEQSMVIFLFLSLILLRIAQDGSRPARRAAIMIGSIVALAAAFLSKETALVIVPTFIGCVLWWGRRYVEKPPANWRRLVVYYTLASIAIAVWGWGIYVTLSPGSPVEYNLYSMNPAIWRENLAYYGRAVFHGYGILPLIALVAFLVRLWKRMDAGTPVDLDFSWNGIFLLLALFSILVYLPSQMREGDRKSVV